VGKKEQTRYLRAKQESLKAYAHNFDIDAYVDYGGPGNGPRERAYHLIGCGYDAAARVVPSAFPSLDRRTRRVGEKWAREALPWNGAHAGLFMANAVPSLYAQMDGYLGAPGEDEIEPVRDPELHLSMRRAVEDFYPRSIRHQSAGGAAGPFIEQCLAEFVVLKTGQPRREVAEGEKSANEFSSALLRGDDPRNDPALVKVQRDYARDYFIQYAMVACTLSSLFVRDAQKLHPKTIADVDPSDPQLTAYHEKALAAWVEAARTYREYVLIEAQDARGSQKQWASTGTG
jgi:hypothetical protein